MMHPRRDVSLETWGGRPQPIPYHSQASKSPASGFSGAIEIEKANPPVIILGGCQTRKGEGLRIEPACGVVFNMAVDLLLGVFKPVLVALKGCPESPQTQPQPEEARYHSEKQRPDASNYRQGVHQSRSTSFVTAPARATTQARAISSVPALIDMAAMPPSIRVSSNTCGLNLSNIKLPSFYYVLFPL